MSSPPPSPEVFRPRPPPKAKYSQLLFLGFFLSTGSWATFKGSLQEFFLSRFPPPTPPLTLCLVEFFFFLFRVLIFRNFSDVVVVGGPLLEVILAKQVHFICFFHALFKMEILFGYSASFPVVNICMARSSCSPGFRLHLYTAPSLVTVRGLLFASKLFLSCDSSLALLASCFFQFQPSCPFFPYIFLKFYSSPSYAPAPPSLCFPIPCLATLRF